MTAGDSISASDRFLMKRLTVLLIVVLVFTAGWSRLHLIYSQKLVNVTGKAEWIWAQHRLSDSRPLAFFATRDFDVPELRQYARLKVLGDPEYTLFLNGREVVGRRLSERRSIEHYDLSELVRTGRNRLVVAVRAPQGIGGLIASLDLGPEIENWLVTDRRWRIYREWRPDLLARDAPDLRFEPPQVLGEPPVGRWNFLGLTRTATGAMPEATIAPRASFALKALRPTIRTRGGVAIAVVDEVRARAFDFGPAASGRIRATTTIESPVSRSIELRFANTREELGEAVWNLRPVVFAPGERVVTTPEVHDFRYVVVLGARATVEVVR